MRKKNKKPKVIYYKDPLNDDFANTNIKAKKIGKNFKFIHNNIFWNIGSFILYYLIAIPIVTIYEKIFLQVKFVNKKALKQLKKVPFFMYGNHTSCNDAFSPNLISFPKKNKIVVSPDAVSIKGLKNIVQMLGGVPVPSDISGMREFVEAMKYYNKKGYNITIYPEAHIWPYYTGVREFKDTSFAYPIMTKSPVVAFFVAYSKPTGFLSAFRKSNITVYISDPIYPDYTKPKKEIQKELRNKVYAFMKDCSVKYSTYEYIVYKNTCNYAEIENYLNQENSIEDIEDENEFEVKS